MTTSVYSGWRFERRPFFLLLLCVFGLAGLAHGQGSKCDLNQSLPPCADCDGNGVQDTCEVELDDGLLGQYYTSNGNIRFAERQLNQVDSQVDFEWGDGSPALGLPANDFAVIWTGTIMVPDCRRSPRSPTTASGSGWVTPWSSTPGTIRPRID